MSKRTIGMLEGEIREASDAELCVSGTSDQYGMLDRMLIESADMHVEFRDVIVGRDALTSEPIYEHRLTKVIVRRDDEAVKVDDLQGKEYEMGDDDMSDDDDAMSHVCMSVDDMEMNHDEEDEIEPNWAPGVKWDLVREEQVEYVEGDVVRTEWSAPVFPKVAIKRTPKGQVRAMLRAIEAGKMSQSALYRAIDALCPLRACARDAKRAIAANINSRPYWVAKYRALVKSGQQDKLGGKAIATLWEAMKERVFLDSL